MSQSWGAKSPQWYNFKSWSKKRWIVVGAVIVIVIVAVIVGAVEGTKANAYPSYTALTYALSETYSTDNFFDNFNYFTEADPTHGFVTYVSQETATSLNLTYASSSSAVLRVDTSDADSSTDGQASQGSPGRGRRSPPTSRNSARVASKKQYNKGLFVFDVIHTPYGCGTWPALWLSDADNWPAHGEIDIMEAVNNATTGNQVTLHTKKGCRMNHKRKQTGKAILKDCDGNANNNAGCGVKGKASTYGQGFNALGGGVTAVEWRSAGIRVWQFARDGIPEDISSKSPDPSSWGNPMADFPKTGCDIDSHFKNQSIVINIDLCGDWAGGAYAGAGCPGTCTDFVANNPSEFTKAYWEFGSFQVYQSS